MPSLRQIRLATGLVLYVYVTLHFANHALGNISIGAMESGLAVQKFIWQAKMRRSWSTNLSMTRPGRVESFRSESSKGRSYTSGVGSKG